MLTTSTWSVDRSFSVNPYISRTGHQMIRLFTLQRTMFAIGLALLLFPVIVHNMATMNNHPVQKCPCDEVTGNYLGFNASIQYLETKLQYGYNSRGWYPDIPSVEGLLSDHYNLQHPITRPEQMEKLRYEKACGVACKEKWLEKKKFEEELDKVL